MDTLLSLEDKTSVRELAQPVSELIVSCTFAGMVCHYRQVSTTCMPLPSEQVILARKSSTSLYQSLVFILAIYVSVLKYERTIAHIDSPIK